MLKMQISGSWRGKCITNLKHNFKGDSMGDTNNYYKRQGGEEKLCHKFTCFLSMGAHQLL